MKKIILTESKFKTLIENITKRLIKEEYERETLLAFVQWLPKHLGFNIVEEYASFGRHYGQEDANMVMNIISNLDAYPEYKDYFNKLMAKKYKK